MSDWQNLISMLDKIKVGYRLYTSQEHLELFRYDVPEAERVILFKTSIWYFDINGSLLKVTINVFI